MANRHTSHDSYLSSPPQSDRIILSYIVAIERSTMLTKELSAEHTSLPVTFKGLTHGQAKSSCSYSFCRQQGSCGSNNQDGTQVLYYATTVLLSNQEVESNYGTIRESL